MNFEIQEALFVSKISNVNHESDTVYAFRYATWLLRVIGIWPFVATRPTKLTKGINRIAFPVTAVFMVILTIPILSHVFLEHPNGAQIIVLGAPISFQLTNLINHYLMVFQSNSMKSCIKHMETDWRRVDNSVDHGIMMRNVRSGHVISVTYILFMYINFLLYHVLLPLYPEKQISEFNVTIKPLIFPAYFHWTVKTTVCILGVLLVGHACGQIQIIIRNIEHLADEHDENDRGVMLDRIAVIVQNHVRLLHFAGSVEVTLRDIFLMEVMISAFILCLLEYYCIMGWNDKDFVAAVTHFVLSGTFIFNILVFCEFGEVFREQYDQIREAAYTIEWYRLPKQCVVAVMMITFMGEAPPKLTAGRMMDLSIASFATTLKTSFAYLNMLRTVTS